MREAPDETRKQYLAEAHKVVAQDPALVFKPFVYADRDLGGKSVSTCKYGCTDDGGKSGIDERLTADYHERPVRLGIICRFVNAVKFSSPHARSSHSSITV